MLSLISTYRVFSKKKFHLTILRFRTFVTTEETKRCQLCVLIGKYISLRPANLTNKWFLLAYRNKKYVVQVVCVHTVSNVPKKIAEYLELPDTGKFTGHCFRRSSATLLVEVGGDLSTLITHEGWKSSSVVRSYIEDSTRKKYCWENFGFI